jgi:hypothetical protein
MLPKLSRPKVLRVANGHRPIIKRCMAPGCGKEFVAKNKAKTCSRECGIKRRWALQRDRYHANQKSMLAYKRKWLAANREKVRARERKRHRTMALRRNNQYYAKLETRRKYRAANREKIRAQARRHYAANREKIRARDRKLRRAMVLRRDNRYYAHLAYMRKYRAANREKINAYARRWYAKKGRGSASVAARWRYMRKYRAANREKLRAQARRWYAKKRLTPLRERQKTALA